MHFRNCLSDRWEQEEEQTEETQHDAFMTRRKFVLCCFMDNRAGQQWHKTLKEFFLIESVNALHDTPEYTTLTDPAATVQ